MTENPWNVDSVNVFYFLKCPECIFDTQEEYSFRDHAIENHPLSFALFHKQSAEEENEENYENYENFDSMVCDNYDQPTDDNKNFDMNLQSPLKNLSNDISNQESEVKKEYPETESLSTLLEVELKHDVKTKSEDQG